MEGLLDTVTSDIETFIRDGIVSVGPITGVSEVVSTNPLLPLLREWFISLLDFIFGFRKKLRKRSTRLGNAMEDIKNGLLNQSDPDMREAGLAAWQMFANGIFEELQKKLDF
jgi:hypothetical protein